MYDAASEQTVLRSPTKQLLSKQLEVHRHPPMIIVSMTTKEIPILTAISQGKLAKSTKPEFLTMNVISDLLESAERQADWLIDMPMKGEDAPT
jgi:hypothetical protein